MGDSVIIVGLLPVHQAHLYQKEGTIIDIQPHKAFPLSVWVNGKVEKFTYEAVQKKVEYAQAF